MLSYPLVVVKGGDGFSSMITTKHEKGHAENRVFKEAVKPTTDKVSRVGRKTVWARFDNPDKALQRSLSLQGKLRNGNSKTELMTSTEWKVVMGYALSWAKDELLADYKAWNGRTNYFLNLTKKQGVYDYFEKNLYIKPNSELYNLIWQEYENTLKKAAAALEEMVSAYRGGTSDSLIVLQYIGGKDRLATRIENFRWVLAQIPIEDWVKQLDGALFFKEAEEYADTVRKAEKYFTSNEFPASGGVESPKSKIYLDFFTKCNDNPDKPLQPFIEELKKALWELDNKK